MMTLGGNGRLHEFLQKYDLLDESAKVRYKTNAAEHYRAKLRNQCENLPFEEAEPTYDVGREVAQCNQAKTAAQIMEASPSIGSEAAPKPKDELDALKENGMYALEQAKGFFSMFATKVRESNVGSNIKHAAIKAKDYSAQAAYTAKDYSVDAATKAKEYSMEKGAALQQSYQDGTLGEKASQKAAKASNMIKSAGNSLMANLDNILMNDGIPPNEREQTQAQAQEHQQPQE